MSVCQWQTSREPTEAAAETRVALAAGGDLAGGAPLCAGGLPVVRQIMGIFKENAHPGALRRGGSWFSGGRAAPASRGKPGRTGSRYEETLAYSGWRGGWPEGCFFLQAPLPRFAGPPPRNALLRFKGKVVGRRPTPRLRDNPSLKNPTARCAFFPTF